ncbi:MAG: 4-hydroxy-tetrahydrodipicolinate reductase [Chitinophagaceae bacterium]|jgi:4-hydroxy-tetrahydrodipicolinate reductase|nr:4-hydroxy-tetrahydrodipicolinate reductase [Chitinophagaceae bacterium]
MKIALIGYGKMGKAIEKVALENGHEIVLVIDMHNPADLNTENLSKAYIAIEFTGPETAENNIRKCIKAGIPVVSGSTGWTENLQAVQQFCKSENGSFLYASNFSIGVNIFFELNRKLAAMMSAHSDYDVTLEEIHHTQKKDAPSGTAITLAEDILKEVPFKKKWVNEISGNKEELSIVSKRIDPAPGTHKVHYSTSIDDIEIIHTAHNRKGFAMGAVLAAEFIHDKKGVFSMKDVLQL